MKTLLLFFALMSVCNASAQRPAAPEKQDTIWGMAVVLDTIPERPNTAVWPAYCITRYNLDGDYPGDGFPHIIAVNYYSFDLCVEIPFSRLIAFKH